MGWLGHPGPQLKADLPSTGSATDLMRSKELEGATWRDSGEFSHRYGHFAPQTRTTPHVPAGPSEGLRSLQLPVTAIAYALEIFNEAPGRWILGNTPVARYRKFSLSGSG